MISGDNQEICPNGRPVDVCPAEPSMLDFMFYCECIKQRRTAGVGLPEVPLVPRPVIRTSRRLYKKAGSYSGPVSGPARIGRSGRRETHVALQGIRSKPRDAQPICEECEQLIMTRGSFGRPRCGCHPLLKDGRPVPPAVEPEPEPF